MNTWAAAEIHKDKWIFLEASREVEFNAQWGISLDLSLGVYGLNTEGAWTEGQVTPHKLGIKSQENIIDRRVSDSCILQITQQQQPNKVLNTKERQIQLRKIKLSIWKWLQGS